MGALPAATTVNVAEPPGAIVAMFGFVVIDDYGAYDGCRRAVDEFLDSQPTRPSLIPVNHEIVYLVKP